MICLLDCVCCAKVRMRIPLVCDLDTFTYALSETHYEMALRVEPLIVLVVSPAPVIAP